MDGVMNRQIEIDTEDAAVTLAMNRDTATRTSTIREFNKENSTEESIFNGAPLTKAESCYPNTLEVSPIMERPGSPVNDATQGNKMSPTPTQKSTPDILLPSVDNINCVQHTSTEMSVPLTKVQICDESASDLNSAETPVELGISFLKNKAVGDESKINVSTVQTVALDATSNSIALNILSTEPEVSVSDIGSDSATDRQNESEMTAVGKEDDGAKDEVLSSEKSSTSSEDVYKLSEYGKSNNLKSSLRTETPVTNNGISVEIPVASGCSKIEGEIFNSDIDKFKAALDPTLPEYLNVLLEGIDVCGDSKCPMDSKPEWFDLEKFRRGQRVAMRYLFGLVFAEMISLLMIFSLPDGLYSLVFTGKSDTPFKSFKRYLSTVIRVRSWYSDDIWKPDTEGHKNIKVVRAMHEEVRQRLQKTKPEELHKKITISGNFKFVCQQSAIWSPLHENIREDFEGSCPYPFFNRFPSVGYRKNPVFVNQMDMALAQFGFVGLFVLFPQRFGAHGISDEDMDSFVHLWQSLGYVLGLEDRYNLCNGDLETVRNRSHDIIRFWVKPSLRLVSRDWEHMTRCVVEGVSYYVPGVTYEMSLLYLCTILGVYTPRLLKALTFTQRLLYHVMTFTFWVMLRLPGAGSFYNWLLNLAIMRAQMASPERLRILEQRRYPYEENATCTRL